MARSVPESSQYDGLGYYLKEVLFDEFQDNRKKLVETKWQDNLNAFKAISKKEWKKDEGKDWRSDTYIQLPKQKIIAGYAMVMDMLLQGGKIPFALIPSPLEGIVLEDLPEDKREFIEDNIDDMTAVINQQLQDCYADRQLMRNVMCAAIYGETYWKKIIHTVKRKGWRIVEFGDQVSQDPQYQRYEKFETSKQQPGYKYLSLWNCFRDMEAEDCQSGAGFFEREMISPYEIRRKIDKPFYLKDAIERAIKACNDGGTFKNAKSDDSLPPVLRELPHRKKTIEHLTFWGCVPKRIAEEFERQLKSGGAENFDILADYESDGNEVEIMAEMADKEVIRYAINDTGERPYGRVVWEEKLDHADATGIADNVQDVAQVVNGMVRAFEDNLKFVANIIIALKKRYLGPGALKDGIKPGMEIEIAEECDDVRKAIQQVTFQDVTPSILNGIPLFERYADEGSQIPKILQGVVAEKHKPDTLGELNMLQQNSGKYLGSVIKNFDEQLIEPVTQYCYDYNMEDPDLDKGKGNYIAQGLGFSSFQDRIMRLQKIMQALNLTFIHEAILAETNIRPLLLDLYKALDIDPTTALKTDEQKADEFKQNMEQQAQLEARTRQVQSEMLAAQTKAKVAEEEAKHDMDLETKELEHAQDKDLENQKFKQDLVLKAVDGGMKNESQRLSSQQ